MKVICKPEPQDETVIMRIYAGTALRLHEIAALFCHHDSAHFILLEGVYPSQTDQVNTDYRGRITSIFTA
jgi:hypothetical protein